MTLITIRERTPAGPNGENATISFDNGPLYNLTQQTPAQILAALQAGNIDLDKGDTQQKTESIIRCIDYSHSNLSPTTQQLLLCLAPSPL